MDSDECFWPDFRSAFIARWPAFLCERFAIGIITFNFDLLCGDHEPSHRPKSTRWR